MKELKVSAIKDGTVIDHIPPENTFKVAEILRLDKIEGNTVSIATNLESKKLKKKGIIKIGGKFLSKEEVNKIALIAPDATVNIIRDYGVKQKINVSLPDFIENIIKCANSNCITNNEAVKTKFYVLEKKPLKVKCYYCERCITKDIELV